MKLEQKHVDEAWYELRISQAQKEVREEKRAIATAKVANILYVLTICGLAIMGAYALLRYFVWFFQAE